MASIRNSHVLHDRVLAVTLARGGSKGLPGKNIRPLSGRPLIAWSIAAGLASSCVDRLICSTDDEQIADIAAQWGAEIPFLRPAPLARDDTTDLEVFDHALRHLLKQEGAIPEFVVQLRPTTPLRDPAWIDRAIARMRADPLITCVRSVAEAPHSPFKMWTVAASRISDPPRDSGDRLAPLLTLSGCDEPYNMPRQLLPKVYWHTGQIDAIRSESILAGSMTGSEIAPIFVPAETAIDIDTLADFQFAELRFNEIVPEALTRWMPDPITSETLVDMERM